MDPALRARRVLRGASRVIRNLSTSAKAGVTVDSRYPGGGQRRLIVGQPSSARTECPRRADLSRGTREPAGGAVNAVLAHAAAKGAWVHAQPFGRAARSFQAPERLIEGGHDVLALEAVQRDDAFGCASPGPTSSRARVGSGRNIDPSLVMTARSTAFSSSRTLPGHVPDAHGARLVERGRRRVLAVLVGRAAARSGTRGAGCPRGARGGAAA